MKDKETEVKEIHPVVEKLRLIMRDRNLTQKAIAEYAETGDTQMSKIFNGSLQLSLWQLSNIASNLQMEVADIFTYPKKYVDRETVVSNADKVSVTFEISADKREHLLKLVMGEK